MDRSYVEPGHRLRQGQPRLQELGVVRRAYWHRFQVLTKRADRLAELDARIRWPQSVWMGVSVEDADFVDRIDLLRETGTALKFLSLEPLLGPLPHFDLRGIDWARTKERTP